MNFSGISRKSFVGRAGRAALALIPQRAAVPVLQGELKGCRWIVGSSIHGCWLGSFEFDKQKMFRHFIAPGTVVYDIGANVGFYTLLASRLTGPRGAVYAFEPLPRNLEMLRRHVTLNTIAGGKCAGNVTVIDAAVSDLDGTATFMPDETPDRAHIVGTGDRHASVEADQAAATTQGITVRTVRIDTLAAGMPGVGAEGLAAPGLIKIDVEGAEAMVLRGAAKTLAEYRPTIFLATHGDAVHAECLAILRGWDYELTPIDGTDIEKVEELVARPR